MLSHFTLVWWRRELLCCWIDICRAGLSFSILSRSACSIDGIRIHYAYALITTMSDLSKFNYEIPSHAPVLTMKYQVMPQSCHAPVLSHLNLVRTRQRENGHQQNG